MSEAVSKQPKRSRRGLILFAVIVLALVAIVVDSPASPEETHTPAPRRKS